MIGFKEVLHSNILDFWISRMVDHENKGFFGRIDGQNNTIRYANKGAVLNARILWTFSAGYRIFRNDKYRKVAERAFDYITNYFIDPFYGGTYWELDYEGNPVQTKKQTYAQGFMLYGFSEFYRATGDPKALDLSISFFNCIERCKDDREGGYWEAFTEDWRPIEDMRLSEKDENTAKTMNTHLHILEPYTNLLRIWQSKELLAAQKNLIEIFIHKIYNSKTGHLGLFFDESWNMSGNIISYGHDIEAVWLLWEAAEIIGADATENIKQTVVQLADAATEGLQNDGSMAYEIKKGVLDEEKHWWVQAEALVGFMYSAKLTGKNIYREHAQKLWKYIRAELIDWENGEWYWSVYANGEPNSHEDKAGFWKCPYHNSRMCMELIENFKIE